jgi:hypothetical protein
MNGSGVAATDAAGFDTLGIRFRCGRAWLVRDVAAADAGDAAAARFLASMPASSTLADHTAGGAAKAAVPPGRDVLTLSWKITSWWPGYDRLVARGRAPGAPAWSANRRSCIADGKRADRGCRRR